MKTFALSLTVALFAACGGVDEAETSDAVTTTYAPTAGFYPRNVSAVFDYDRSLNLLPQPRLLVKGSGFVPGRTIEVDVYNAGVITSYFVYSVAPDGTFSFGRNIPTSCTDLVVWARVKEIGPTGAFTSDTQWISGTTLQHHALFCRN